MARQLSEETLRDTWKVYARYGYNMRDAAQALDINYSTFVNRISQCKRRLKLSEPEQRAGKQQALQAKKLPLPPPGKIKRYFLTSAQNNTSVVEDWATVEAFCAARNAELKISTYTYMPTAEGSAKRGTQEGSELDIWYAPEVEEHISDNYEELAPGLVWCGNSNTLPTAERPLRGNDSYTGRSSGIFPHPRQHQASIASHKSEATKFNFSTGTVTKRHYLQKRAGIRAEQFHVYGGLLVEVNSKGHWWARHVVLDDQGCMYDLELKVNPDGTTETRSPEAIAWGDLHKLRTSPVVQRLAWAKGGMLDALRPKKQLFHDLIDFYARSHHAVKNHHEMYERWVNGQEKVDDELSMSVKFLAVEAFRAWCETIIVYSNHDAHLERWLREANPKTDPPNAITYHKLEIAKLEAIAARNKRFILLEYALQALHGLPVSAACFLRQDDPLVLCKSRGGGVQAGMHGDKGPGGTRGTLAQLSRMGRRVLIGHSHSAGLLDGSAQVGTSSEEDMGYNEGPGSWSATHGVVYENGQIALVTMFNDDWRAR